jgi:hypothetical protein
LNIWRKCWKLNYCTMHFNLTWRTNYNKFNKFTLSSWNLKSKELWHLQIAIQNLNEHVNTKWVNKVKFKWHANNFYSSKHFHVLYIYKKYFNFAMFGDKIMFSLCYINVGWMVGWDSLCDSLALSNSHGENKILTSDLRF